MANRVQASAIRNVISKLRGRTLGLFLGLPLTLVLGISWSVSARAGTYFDHLRKDSTVPEACRQLEMTNFKGPLRIIRMGTKGARKKGFGYEYPMKRDTARALWAAGRALAQKHVVDDVTLDQIRKDPDGVRFLEIIQNNFQAMGFDFHSEGEVLELLGLVSLRGEYPPAEYFHTGGVAYHKRGEGTIIGELDLIVGRRNDCRVVVVGEAKLGNASSHAKDQMRRFQQFLGSKGKSY